MPRAGVGPALRRGAQHGPGHVVPGGCSPVLAIDSASSPRTVSASSASAARPKPRARHPVPGSAVSSRPCGAGSGRCRLSRGAPISPGRGPGHRAAAGRIPPAAELWGHAHRAAAGPWVHVQPGDGETFEALRDRMETLLSSVRSCRFAEHRCLAADPVLDHETLQPALLRVQTVAIWETSHGKPPATVPSCGQRGGAAGRLPSTSRAGSHKLDPRRDELYLTSIAVKLVK
jgi:hypothetical protein